MMIQALTGPQRNQMLPPPVKAQEVALLFLLQPVFMCSQIQQEISGACALHQINLLMPRLGSIEHTMTGMQMPDQMPSIFRQAA